MNQFTVVFESPTKWDSIFIKKYLKSNIPVWFIEPFHSYHHKKGIRFFPSHLPSYGEELVKGGRVLLLRADEINAREIYLLSADKAVNAVESVFPEYKKKYEKIFSYVSDTLKSPVAENVFRMNLCNRLAEFYSTNILLHRIEKYLNNGPILVYPDMNVYSYLFIKKVLIESEQEFFEHLNIRFPIQAYVKGFWENLKRNLISTAKVLAQTLASGLLGRQQLPAEGKKKIFSYGITIVSPRQLRDNKRSPDFLIDNKEILGSEVLYFPLMPLTTDQQEMLAKLPGEVYYLPKVGRYFSHFSEWKGLLWHALKRNFLRNGEELYAASAALLNYFRWKKVLDDIEIKHFITHADFGMGHVGRNISLNQAGIQTWYFTDSMNNLVTFREEMKCGMHHPFWAYLYYDHLVTWDAALAQYYKEHPGSFKETHIVGCLWSQHIEGKKYARARIGMATLRNLSGSFVVGCFDSTYTMNGFTSYAEGVAFARHLLQIADEFPDIHIILKEKKDRDIHHILDPIVAPSLIEIYNKMDSHPRITICSNNMDTSELISISDMVVSFPFTSTTFEAMSIDRPAIWHDPIGYYRSTPYGKIGGVTTHGYEELKEKIAQIMEIGADNYENPVPIDSPLTDPYRDDKAIDRFRELLLIATPVKAINTV